MGADFITLTLEVRKVYNKVARRVLNEEKEKTDIVKIEKRLVKEFINALGDMVEKG